DGALSEFLIQAALRARHRDRHRGGCPWNIDRKAADAKLLLLLVNGVTAFTNAVKLFEELVIIGNRFWCQLWHAGRLHDLRNALLLRTWQAGLPAPRRRRMNTASHLREHTHGALRWHLRRIDHHVTVEYRDIGGLL